jgi:hypothetical protein
MNIGDKIIIQKGDNNPYNATITAINHDGSLTVKVKYSDNEDEMRVYPPFIPSHDVIDVRDMSNEQKFELKTFNFYDELYCYEMLDGYKVTYYVRDDKFGVCLEDGSEHAYDPNSIYWQMAKGNDIETIIRSHGDNIAMQGVIVGENVKDNYYELTGNYLYIISLYDIDVSEFINQWDFYDFLFNNKLRGSSQIYNANQKGESLNRQNGENIFTIPTNLGAFVDETKSLLNPNLPIKGIFIGSNNQKMRCKYMRQ